MEDAVAVDIAPLLPIVAPNNDLHNEPGQSELVSGDENSNRRRSLRPAANKKRSHCSHRRDDLDGFRTCLLFLGLDQSSNLNVLASWIVFLLLALVVPVLNLVFVRCSNCNSFRTHPFEKVVQISESTIAIISFLCLSHNLRKYGLCRFLFLDQIHKESSKVQQGYRKELNKAYKLLAKVLIPSFLVELVYQVWWFTYSRVHLTFIHNDVAKNVLTCSAVMISWLYKAYVFIFPCILFRLMCYLQNLRFEGYIKMLEDKLVVPAIMKEHIRLRHHLYKISHRYRIFIVTLFVVITASQFYALLLVTSTTGPVNFFTAGDLMVSSAIQVVGFLICLHGAARITHKAQSIVSVVSQWHASITCEEFAAGESDIENFGTRSSSSIHHVDSQEYLNSESDLDSTVEVYSIFREQQKDVAASFQLRQALVTYLQHNSSGITVFGLVLDRTLLQLIFMIELSLVSWLLGKTVGIP